MDGVLLTITEEPSMYEMDGEELPDIDFVEKNKKIVSSSKEDLLNEMKSGTIISSKVENLAKLEQKPIENLVQEETDEMVDVPLDEETAQYLLGLLGNKEED